MKILLFYKNSTYAGARTSTWVKLKIVSEVDAVVAGYTEGRGSRRFFGALVLGLYEGKELKFIGSVGTGFDEAKQEKIFDQLERRRTKTSPFAKMPALRENVTPWMPGSSVIRVICRGSPVSSEARYKCRSRGLFSVAEK